MGNRQTAEHLERLLVSPESLERITMEEIPQDPEREERTEPIRLPFIALLAERDPLVQARLNLRRTLALEAERISEENRPTDPMLPGKSRA